ncbi:uncharacterized protein LOC131673567 [Phymastichus coffea]|uniref:uncharacterized protein LOC131673567 n=1 Tax=Phymastichus coffea TaxID=108790 RepID=UPI00273C9BBD|nr:uncharacterized protein LOC131673567 [Phymastichus coffea]
MSKLAALSSFGTRRPLAPSVQAERQRGPAVTARPNRSEDKAARMSRRSSDDRARELEIAGVVSGRNVLITGGAAGLGHAFVGHFLQFDANKICVLDADEASGKRLASSVDKSHGPDKLIFVHADVSRHDHVRAAFAEADSLMGGIDIVVNNAGVLDERRWEREIAVNLAGMVSVATLAMEHMGRDKSGRGGILVNVAEHSDTRSTVQLPVYTATKQAVIGLSRSLAAACNAQRTGVKVLALCPGLTETALTIDSPNKLFSRFMKADFVKNLEQLAIQTPYVVGQGLMSILRSAESGSIWVIQNGQPPYQVFVPNYRSLRRLYKDNFTVSDTSRHSSKGRPIREVCDNTRTGLMSCVSRKLSAADGAFPSFERSPSKRHRPTMQIKDKRAMIVGASNGLSLAFGKELLRNGVAKVLMVDLDAASGESQAEKLNEEFGRNRASFLGCDVTKGPEFDSIFRQAVGELGGLDIVVNNAATIDEVNFLKTIDTNVTAVFRANMLGVQLMGKDSGGRGGVIVNVASVLGLEAFPQLPVYSATNHAVIAFSRSFSQPYHFQRTGVRIIVLCPGLTESPLLDNLSKDEFVERPEELVQAMKDIRPQRAESVAHALVYVVRCAQNGSVWITEDGKPVYEIQMPDTLPTK